MAYIVLSPETLPHISTVINFIISFTPLLSYGSTVLSIRKKKSSQGFSIDICGTMLLASILRIFYYFNDPFEITLLRQCFVMVFIQTILLRTALKYRSDDAIHFEIYHSNWGKLLNHFVDQNKETFETILDNYNVTDSLESFEIQNTLIGISMLLFNMLKLNIGLLFVGISHLMKNIIRFFDYHYARPFYYWQWKQSSTFWKFLLGFVIFLTVIQLIFHGNEYLGITFGTISFLVESSLPLPQIILFQRLKHVENFKVILLLSWLGGDVTKISYLFYGTDNIDIIFILAAFFQMSLNFVITYQFFYYKFHPGNPTNEFQMHYLPVAHTNTNSTTPVNGGSDTPFPTPFTTTTNIHSPSLSLHSQSINTMGVLSSPSINMNGHLSFTRAPLSRGQSLSLSGAIGTSPKANVIPQHQHFQHKKSLSNVNEESYQLANNSKKMDDINKGTTINLSNTYDDLNITIDDGIDFADGIDYSTSKHGKYADDISNKRSISIGVENVGDLDMTNENGASETVISRKSTLHSTNVSGKHVRDVFQDDGLITEESKTANSSNKGSIATNV